MNRIPSVTEVLSPWSDFSKVRPDVLEAAAERGSMVHRACGAIAKGVWAPPVPEEYAGYVQSFSIWLRMAVEDVILVEPELVHPVYGYCGHPDLIVRIKGDEGFTLPDLKTPVATSPTWPPQLAGYKELAEANGYPIQRILSVRLRKSGTMPVIDEYTGSLNSALAVFLSCLTAWKYFKGDQR